MEKKYPFILQFCKGTEAADSYQGQAVVQLFCSWSCRHWRKVYHEKVGKEYSLTEGEVIHTKCKVKSSREECVHDTERWCCLCWWSWLFFSAMWDSSGTHRVHMWTQAVELNLKLWKGRGCQWKDSCLNVFVNRVGVGRSAMLCIRGKEAWRCAERVERMHAALSLFN